MINFLLTHYVIITQSQHTKCNKSQKTRALDPKHESRARTSELVGDVVGDIGRERASLLITDLVSRVGDVQPVLAIR